jgi:hypothetical protein|tara:strand:+ start:86 stop:868 length:783 start_codon:yes stop_codon:yes gene_type:complete
MPENYTVTYSETVKGWPSFYSYFPDFILGMNQYLYTFKSGNLYRHNTNPIRNRYYGEDYDSTLTGVFNQEPTTVKVFKTIELESDDNWDINITTDLGAGFMPASDFVKKEGSFFAFIKRISGSENLALRSTQGIGSFVTTTGSSPGTITIEFDFRVSSLISIGDELNYSLLIAGNTYSSPIAVGEITAISSDRKTLSVDATDFLPVGSVVPSNAYILVLKDPVAESYGATGYYLEFKITNDSKTAVELFTVDSEVFKSNP